LVAHQQAEVLIPLPVDVHPTAHKSSPQYPHITTPAVLLSILVNPMKSQWTNIKASIGQAEISLGEIILEDNMKRKKVFLKQMTWAVQSCAFPWMLIGITGAPGNCITPIPAIT
jgi:hypothetical protein